ncbi:MAG: hypothetical protein V1788_02235 [Nanoarchaeota archaeon]|nr:hypothetical protein [Nanoarchaeota archaeon]
MVDGKETDYFNGEYEGGALREFGGGTYVVLYPNRIMGVVSRLIEGGAMNYSVHLYQSIEGLWRRVENFRPIPKDSKLGRELVELEEKGAFKK